MVEAVLNSLGQEVKFCAVKLPTATRTPLHWPLPTIKPPAPRRLGGGNGIGTRRKKPPLWLFSDNIQRGGGRGRERLKQRRVCDDSEPTGGITHQ